MSANLRKTIKNFAQGLFLGGLVVAVLVIIFPSDAADSRKAKAAEDYLTVNYQSINDTAYERGDPVSWGDDTEAEVGDRVQFYVEAQNINAALEAEDFTVKAYLPNFEGGDVQSWARVSTSSIANTSQDRTYINIPEGARLVYQPGTTKVTADMDQDGSKEYDGTTWDDSQGRIDKEGINLGTLTGGEETVQIEFYAVVAEEIDPELTVRYEVNNLTDGSGWQNDVDADNSDTLKFYIEVHNIAIPSTAENLNVWATFPAEPENSFTSTAFADADNASQVSDNVVVNLAENADLTLVSNSTRVTWDSDGDGDYEYEQRLWPQDVFTDGGISNFGDLYGCNPFILTLTFEAVVGEEEPEPIPTATPTPEGESDLSIEKYVKWEETDDWYEDIDKDEHLFDPGETVEYKIIVKNNGEADAEEVQVMDEVPDYISWESGDGDWDSDDREIEFDLGTVEAGESVRIDYEGKVFDEDDLPLTDREQKNVATLYQEDEEIDDDHTQVWINGPEIAGEEITKLPEAGGDSLATLIIAVGMMVTGWGLRGISLAYRGKIS